MKSSNVSIDDIVYDVIYYDKKAKKDYMTVCGFKSINEVKDKADKINDDNKIAKAIIETCHKESYIPIENINDYRLKFNAVYRHFKHTDEDPLNYMYVTICEAEPAVIDSELYKDIISKGKSMFYFDYTEDKNLSFNLYYYNDKFYYEISNFDLDKINEKKLVIYKSLYDNHLAYGRPRTMFLSPVDKNKYPDSKQYYRFELI